MNIWDSGWGRGWDIWDNKWIVDIWDNIWIYEYMA